MFHGSNIHYRRTSGHVNANLTPCPGIYFNAFIHVYSPRAGADNLFGTNVDVNRKRLLLCSFVASFKAISLKFDFKHILNNVYMYIALGQGQTTPWGQNFDINRNSLSLCPFVDNLKTKRYVTEPISIFISRKSDAESPGILIDNTKRINIFKVLQ